LYVGLSRFPTTTLIMVAVCVVLTMLAPPMVAKIMSWHANAPQTDKHVRDELLREYRTRHSGDELLSAGLRAAHEIQEANFTDVFLGGGKDYAEQAILIPKGLLHALHHEPSRFKRILNQQALDYLIERRALGFLYDNKIRELDGDLDRWNEPPDYDSPLYQ